MRKMTTPPPEYQQRGYCNTREKSKCFSCGATLVWRRGRYGLFLACSKWPKCKGPVQKPNRDYLAERELMVDLVNDDTHWSSCDDPFGDY